MAAFVSPLLLTLSGLLRITSAQQYCRDYKECSNREELSSSGSVLCYGAYSCDNTKSISTSQGGPSNFIVCDGVGACSNVQSMNSKTQYCRAPFSCSNSTFVSAQYAYCLGALSCTNSLFYIINEINAYGELSLLNSTITVTDSSVDIHCYGHLSCYGSNIECVGASVCNIYCYSTGCFGLSTSGDGIVYFNNASNGTVEVNAAMSYGLNAIDHNAGDIECAVQFDTYQWLYQVPSVKQSTDGAICARGESSCQGVGYLNISDSTLICSGRYACTNIGLIDGDHADVYCSALESCGNSLIKTDGNIICDAAYGCYESVIVTSGNVSCSSIRACGYANITIKANSVSFIVLSGEWSGRNASILCEEDSICSIECLGESACYGMTVYCIGAQCDVECSMDTDCPLVTSSQPTSAPTFAPTEATSNPTFSPTDFTSYPTYQPSSDPTFDPTAYPLFEPSQFPTIVPTKLTHNPTGYPTSHPSLEPTTEPTMEPTFVPLKTTLNPSAFPSSEPSQFPTIAPTFTPAPSEHFSKFPSIDPTLVPTLDPTKTLSELPSIHPTQSSLVEEGIVNTEGSDTGTATSAPSSSESNVGLYVFIGAILFGLLFCFIGILVVMKKQFNEDVVMEDADDSVRHSIQMENQLSVEHVVQPNIDQTAEDIKMMFGGLNGGDKMRILNDLNSQLNGDGEDSVEQDLEGKVVETVMDDEFEVIGDEQTTA